MIRWLTRKLAARHRCRNTSLCVFAEKAEGHGPQVIVEMTDKCTGAAYQAAFTLPTAEHVAGALATAIRTARGESDDDVPIIRSTPAEMHTEQFWAREITPLALPYAFDPTQLEQDPGDRHAHLLKTPGGQVIAIVRTDGQPLCCPYHDRFPTVGLSCERARSSRSALGWDEVYGSREDS